MSSLFRIHPAINIARVGSSEEYYIAPETAAGEAVTADGTMGGLPIQAGTEDSVIGEADLRDAKGLVKRQAARFRIFAYDEAAAASYPSGQGTEVKLGDKLPDGRTVLDIVWTVHVANKKLNNYAIGPNGLDGYRNLSTVPIRNEFYPTLPPVAVDRGSPQSQAILGQTRRLQELVIDPGPRTLQASTAGRTGAVAAFDQATQASYADAATGEVIALPDYPISFPSDWHSSLYQPLGPLASLGDIRVDSSGRLIVAGGFGHTAAVQTDGTPPPLIDPTENGLWFDDTSDGPVNAVLVFDNGTCEAVHGAWVVTGDPGYAPQIRNVVSAWDDVYDVWVRELNLQPQLFRDGFDTSYKPSFKDQVLPIFHACMLQRWATNLPPGAVAAHDMIGAIQPADDPAAKIPNLARLIRNPDGDAVEIETGSPLMPLSLGDIGKSFLTVSRTQYFFLKQWHAKQYEPDGKIDLGPGERLDHAALANCLGGRYSPGIEVSFPVRDTHLYIADWRTVGCGPFRVNQAPLDYSKAAKGQPFLGVGYIPLHDFPVQPGDVSKFMSVPWHTDYNSCAVHVPDPNPNLTDGSGMPLNNNTLFWSWPAERPVQVHPKELCSYDEEDGSWHLGGQVFSIRGPNTETGYPANAGKFQSYLDYVENWQKVGFVIQGTRLAAPDGEKSYGPDLFLEVQSGFPASAGPLVQPWPTANVPPVPKS